MLSKRIKKIKESGIRKFFDLAAENKGSFIDLSIGQPHFPVSAKLKKAAKIAIDSNCNSYTSSAGRPDLRKKIAAKLRAENNISAKPEEIIMTAGVSGALFLAFGACLDPGDEIIVPDPYFVFYKEILTFLGIKIVFLDTYPDFHIDSEKLKKLITPKTKAILLNSPNNPTGAVYTKEELKKIAQIAKKRNLLIISDEIYEKFDYDDKFFSIGSIYKNTLTLNGFSKSQAITGWRLGYAHGPQYIIEAMKKLQQYSFICAPSLVQAALETEMNLSLSEEIKKYKAKRDFVYENLKDKFDLNRPEGAIFAFVKIPKGKKNFSEKLMDNKLLAVPGKVFSKKSNYFRISFAVDDKILKKGVQILRKLAQ
ncbi:aspartate aminotransferase [Candidatus Falkowbacteria bacterium CG11_big_fil_rev_8_21_14_0_20_39_10]|uniref:Aminotransferase n=1 Tax=Candidatus Falkowbacteria bacterium CG11_big_fil_rev_8_21_14_0_20_39_10 TaxID=1974570 RepID=A0A2M6K8Y6_9BACT|nr:MAG: aspartate aminotransferase [Candidatus Falkowbacteria bacterium CG11_big_fil_rev_8_21_14_0_20_39_10]